jgi:hypothetical protein
LKILEKSWAFNIRVFSRIFKEMKMIMMMMIMLWLVWVRMQHVVAGLDGDATRFGWSGRAELRYKREISAIRSKSVLKSTKMSKKKRSRGAPL